MGLGARRAVEVAEAEARALGHDRVGTEHLLLGVLDVEGTAGQVLRGLGVDIDRLRSSLEGAGPAPQHDPDPPSISARCPGCGSGLDGHVAYEVLDAAGPRGPRDVVVLSCSRCGHAVGIAKA